MTIHTTTVAISDLAALNMEIADLQDSVEEEVEARKVAEDRVEELEGLLWELDRELDETLAVLRRGDSEGALMALERLALGSKFKSVADCKAQYDLAMTN